MTVQTDADSLPLIKKVELFEYAMENTTGQDLYKVCVPPPDQSHLEAKGTPPRCSSPAASQQPARCHQSRDLIDQHQVKGLMRERDLSANLASFLPSAV